MEPILRPATPGDLPAVETLLASFDLPTAGVAEHIEDFTIIEHGGTIIASAGIERYSASALLRSVAVHPEYRSRGLARRLVERVLDRARRGGVRNVYLLTSTAANYFARVGFTAIPDAAVDAAVRTSKEFETCCCDGAQAMHLVLGGGS